MKNLIFFFSLLVCQTSTAQLSQYLVKKYTYDGTSTTNSKDDSKFIIQWTATYEGSLKYMVLDGQRTQIEKKLRTFCDGKFFVFFKNYEKNAIIELKKAGIQEAFDNAFFTDAAVNFFVNLFDTEETPKYTLISIKINSIKY